MFPGKYQLWNFQNILQAHQRRNRDSHKQQQKKLSPYQLKNWYSSLSLPKNISKHVKTRHADLVYFLLTGSTHEKKCMQQSKLTHISKNDNYKRSRSSCIQVFCKKSVLKNFSIFTRKNLCRSLFLIKMQACNFIKKETPS